VVDPKALDELLPDWREDGCPMAETPVTDNWHWVLTKRASKTRCRTWPMPPFMSNDGNYTGSSATCAAGWRARPRNWASRSSPAFRPAKCSITNTARSMASPPATWALPSDGSHKGDYQPGMELHAKYTVFCEGARGHLTKQLEGAVRS
jgi:electron-transferring-flavoprotein dehydrogenase